MTFRQVEKKLKQAGWVEIRVNGSHHLFRHRMGGPTVPVPYKSGRDIAEGTLKKIEKATGLPLSG